MAREDLGYKGRGDIVTATDLAVEARIQQIIEAAYPDHGILSEETRSTTKTDGWVWVIDPIDGTTNFFQGIPFFCVNIALCFDGQPVLGLTYDPLQRDEFLARPGKGLQLNGKPVAASTASLADATAVFDFALSEKGMPAIQAFAHLSREVLHARVMGSAALALAYAACGRIDLFVFAGGKPWDLAAGIALVTEAGGVVTDLAGGPATIEKPGIVAGSPAAVEGFFARVGDAEWYRTP